MSEDARTTASDSTTEIDSDATTETEPNSMTETDSNDTAGIASDTTAETAARETDDRTERQGRDVVVPMRLYKTVTVFSTLIAVVSVVLGFMLLDAATLNVSFLGNIVRGVLAAVGLAIGDGLLSTAFAVFGLAIIAFGAGVYVIGTRFRARGMGKSQEDSGEDSNNNG